MNAFRLSADILHALAVLLLLGKMGKRRSCSGISCVAQVLYLVTFITRYLDLPFVFFSYYNTAMKHYFIFATACTVFLMLVARDTYDSNHDSKWMFLLLVPPAVLSQFVNYEYSVIEVGFAFSQFLEAVAMLPQFVMICKMGQAEVTVVCYLRMLASYRLLYIFNWIYRYNMEGFYDGISVVSGTVQFLTYAVFFALFYNAGMKSPTSEAEPMDTTVLVSPTDSAQPRRDNFIQAKGLTKYYDKLASLCNCIRLVIARECFAFCGKRLDNLPNSEEAGEKQCIVSVDPGLAAENAINAQRAESCVPPAADPAPCHPVPERSEKSDVNTTTKNDALR